jgi:hypothetical protein
MGSDESTAQQGQASAGNGRGGEEGPSPTDEFVSQSKTCPECGEPVHDVRKTCPNCGYEYKEEDYDNKDAGEEFVAGSQIDETRRRDSRRGGSERAKRSNRKEATCPRARSGSVTQFR